MAIRNPFRVPELRAMFDKAIELASDNRSDFYVARLSSGHIYGPAYPRTGAGHRCAFWAGYKGQRSTYDGTRGGKDSYGYAAYRAGVEFRKNTFKGT